MRIPPRITRLGAVSALASTLLLGGTAVAATPATPAVATARSAVAASSYATAAYGKAVHIQDVGKICYSRLPSQAHDTLDLIAQGGPYPYPKDGTVFDNREGVLPAHDTGYYHEYTVKTPGSPDRGARRIVTGRQANEDYYTADHYKSFDLVDRGC
ncbi:ribonuclease domain-containing protein [Streptomyces sp. NPDC001339]|uniref:ribonuclease domain-containing protein n=1 Tax=Streptomyces sp. NPDC001339 TaxID=3364563 RepID=UPI0036C9DC6D